MKKLVLSLALCMFAGAAMAQSAEDKAKAKAEAAALKAATKQAKAQLKDGQKQADQLEALMKDPAAAPTEEQITKMCQDGLSQINAALKSGLIDEKELGAANKARVTLSYNLHNLLVQHAAQSTPFDTAAFLPNLIQLTDGLSDELKYTKVVKGETGNEAYLKQRKDMLQKSKIFYIYAAQFEGECRNYESSVKAYEMALDYNNRYNVQAECPIEDSQIAYYIYENAHECKNFEIMDKYYPQAVKFDKGAERVKQLVSVRYLEVGDTARWASELTKQALANPESGEEDIQRLLGFYQRKGTAEMINFADQVLAVSPDSKIANYGKGYALFYENKYDDALTYFVKCTEIDPDYIDAWIQCGLCKYRTAVNLNATTDKMKKQADIDAVVKKVKKISAEAIPYFERVQELAPEDPTKWAYELKICYKSVGNNAKAAEMEKLLQ